MKSLLHSAFAGSKSVHSTSSICLLLLLGSPLATAQITVSPPQMLSISSDGTQASDDDSEVYRSSSVRRTVTSFGNFSVFDSQSTNLQGSLPAAPGGFRNGYIWSAGTSTAKLQTPNAAGTATANGSSSGFNISGGGGYCVFSSRATDLVAGFVDNNGGGHDAYLRNNYNDTTTLVSKNLSGEGTRSRGVEDVIISSNGGYIFFKATDSMDLTGVADGNGTGFADFDLFRYDVYAGTTELVNINLDGDASSAESIGRYSTNYDGSLVAFESSSTDLHADHGGGGVGIFIRDMNSSQVIVATKNASSSTGVWGTGTKPVLSYSGRYLLFESYSTELTGDTILHNTGNVYIRNIIDETTTLVSRNQAGTSSADASSVFQQMTSNGRYIVFGSRATDLIAGVNPTGLFALYRFDRLTQDLELVSVNEGGTQTINASASSPSISEAGRLIAYDSRATDVVAGLADVGTSSDVFLRDMVTKTTVCLSRKADGSAVANNDSEYATLSGEGNLVVFVTDSSDITPLTDANDSEDVIVSTLVLDRPMTAFCDPMDANSTGMSTTLSGSIIGGLPTLFGQPHVSDVNLQCTSGVPGYFGYYLVGSGFDETGVSFGSGRLCLSMTGGNVIGRFNVSGFGDSIGQFDSNGILQNLAGNASSTGGSGYDVPYTIPSTPSIQMGYGSTWYFQVWHRDVNGTSNLSNGLSVTF